jgi:hypothetical protein
MESVVKGRPYGNLDEAIRHHQGVNPVAGGDLVDLVLHRAGVGVDEDAHGLLDVFWD